MLLRSRLPAGILQCQLGSIDIRPHRNFTDTFSAGILDRLSHQLAELWRKWLGQPVDLLQQPEERRDLGALRAVFDFDCGSQSPLPHPRAMDTFCAPFPYR